MYHSIYHFFSYYFSTIMKNLPLENLNNASRTRRRCGFVIDPSTVIAELITLTLTRENIKFKI